jgi:hypothetical protein
LYTSPVTNNNAIYTLNNNLDVGAHTFKVTWDGNQDSHPRYVPKESSTYTFDVFDRETPPPISLTITPNPSAFLVNTTFVATMNTTTPFTGVINFVDTGIHGGVIGSATVENNQATFATSSLATGTHAIYAYFPGSATAPKYYSTSSNTVSLDVAYGLPISGNLAFTVSNDSYQGTQVPYVVGETTYLRASTSSSVRGGVVRFYNGGVLLGEVNFAAGGFAELATTFASTGTKALRAYWPGHLYNGSFYEDKVSETVSIDVINGYTLPRNITVSASSPRVIDENITFTASVTTSTKMANTVTFYANNVEIGKSSFSTTTNTASITTTLSSTGTYVLRADWAGGYVEDNRLYLPKTGTTSTTTVALAGTIGANLVLSVPETPNIVSLPTVFTVTLNTSTSIDGTNGGLITYTDSVRNTVIGTSYFTNNVSKLTLTNVLSIGTYSVTANWAGRTIAPKYFGKTSNSLGLSIVPKSTTTITISVPKFKYYNAYPSNILGLANTATITVNGVYAGHGPSGSIGLYSPAGLIGTGTINTSTHQTTIQLPVNALNTSTSFTAQYAGDDWNNPANYTLYKTLAEVAVAGIEIAGGYVGGGTGGSTNSINFSYLVSLKDLFVEDTPYWNQVDSYGFPSTTSVTPLGQNVSDEYITNKNVTITLYHRIVDIGSYPYTYTKGPVIKSENFRYDYNLQIVSSTHWQSVTSAMVWGELRNQQISGYPQYGNVYTSGAFVELSYNAGGLLNKSITISGVVNGGTYN